MLPPLKLALPRAGWGMYCASCGTQTETSDCESCGEAARLDGRYALEAMVGRGAHGTTWRARDSDGGLRAIKELPLRLGVPDKTVALFRREAQVLAQLDHPGLPRFHEAFETGAGRNRVLWIVLAFIQGPTLEEELLAHRYDEGDVMDIVEELLGTLAWLHSRSPPIVHRDIKPANVIRAEDDRLVLVDFGSVRDALRDPDLGGSTITGTFGFMAPEQFAGDAEPRTDLFGLGALAIALLTRVPPHSLQDAHGAFIWRSRAQVSPATAAFLDAMTAPELSARPSSSEHALELLARARRDGSRTTPTGTALVSVDPAPPVVAAPDRLRGRRAHLTGQGSIVFTHRHHSRAIRLIEDHLGGSGRSSARGDTLTWETGPSASRRVQVVIHPTEAGSTFQIREDHRGLWGGLVGGLGGLGGGLGGALAWLVFSTSSSLGIAFVASIFVGSLLLASGIALGAQRLRARSLLQLREQLEERLQGPGEPHSPVPQPRHPAGISASAGLLIGLALVCFLSAGIGLVPAASLLVAVFVAAFIPAAFSWMPRQRSRP